MGANERTEVAQLHLNVVTHSNIQACGCRDLSNSSRATIPGILALHIS
jgi:hypothetical protein